MDPTTHLGIGCLIFADENISHEYIQRIVDSLGLNDIRRIYFITKSNTNEFTSDFYGLLMYIPKGKINLVEEKDVR